MKINFKYISIFLLIPIIASCSYDLDDIIPMDSGEDVEAPKISIIYPSEGTLLRVAEDITSIDINCDVTDDIELKDINIELDGISIKEQSDFIDYRHSVVKFNYDNITSGNHILTVIATDLSGKESTSSVSFSKAEPYHSQFDGEVMYFPFDGDYTELISITQADIIGNPAFSTEAKIGNSSYTSTEGSYISFPADAITANKTCTFTFWYKVNAIPDRAGILILGDDDQGVTQTRTHGFRVFREASGDSQRIKANVGTGSTDVWCDGFLTSSVNPEWVFVALVIDTNKLNMYYNGELALSSDLPDNIDWTNCNYLTILNGGPSFSYWNHKYDASLIDDLRGFSKALTIEEIKSVMDAI